MTTGFLTNLSTGVRKPLCSSCFFAAVKVANPDAAPVVRFQLQDPAGTTQWCAALESGVEIPWGALLTNCWSGGSPQIPLQAGQLIEQGGVTPE